MRKQNRYVRLFKEIHFYIKCNFIKNVSFNSSLLFLYKFRYFFMPCPFVFVFGACAFGALSTRLAILPLGPNGMPAVNVRTARYHMRPLGYNVQLNLAYGTRTKNVGRIKPRKAIVIFMLL